MAFTFLGGKLSSSPLNKLIKNKKCALSSFGFCGQSTLKNSVTHPRKSWRSTPLKRAHGLAQTPFAPIQRQGKTGETFSSCLRKFPKTAHVRWK